MILLFSKYYWRYLLSYYRIIELRITELSFSVRTWNQTTSSLCLDYAHFNLLQILTILTKYNCIKHQQIVSFCKKPNKFYSQKEKLKFDQKYTEVTRRSFANTSQFPFQTKLWKFVTTLAECYPQTIILTKKQVAKSEAPLFSEQSTVRWVNWQSDNLRVTIKTWHYKSSSWHVRGAWPIGH